MTISSEIYSEALKIVQHLTDAGHRAIFAGGCVRDALLGRPVNDIDIATSATPDKIERLFPGRTLAVGKSFGVIVIVGASSNFEIATFRDDGTYSDGRHPEHVKLADEQTDAKRRDFTVNGIFFDPLSERILDYVGGLVDLHRKVIRAIGLPSARFREDRLRMLRAVRFASTLGFALDEETAQAIREEAKAVNLVSNERIGQEFSRMLTEAIVPSQMLEELLQLGLLERILPEIAALKGVRQPPQFHPEGDVWTHTCMMLDKLKAPRNAHLAYAVLLHDVGKAKTTVEVKTQEGKIDVKSPNHAAVGADMAEVILRRLRLNSECIDTVTSMVRRHMTFVEFAKMRRAKQRRFMGVKTFPMELELNRLDILCSCGDMRLFEISERIFREFKAEPVLPPQLISGKDLIAAGIKPGMQMGNLLRRAYDRQLEEDNITKAKLLDWLLSSSIRTDSQDSND